MIAMRVKSLSISTFCDAKAQLHLSKLVELYSIGIEHAKKAFTLEVHGACGIDCRPEDYKFWPLY